MIRIENCTLSIIDLRNKYNVQLENREVLLAVKFWFFQCNQTTAECTYLFDAAHFRVSLTKRSRPLLTRPTQKSMVQLLAFLNLYQPAKKSVYFICSVFETQSILESRDLTGHTHFWPSLPNKFLINFHFLWVCINMQKISLFYLFILQMVNFRVPSGD